MPVIKEKVGLVCDSVEFTRFSIIYKVSPEKKIPDNNYAIHAHNSISDKDLILKPTIFNMAQQEVIFTPSNVTPAFYSDLADKSIKDYEEYAFEVNSVYKEGDVVAYILVDRD